MMRLENIADTFTRPCLICGATVHTEASVEQPHDCQPIDSMPAAIAKAYWSGYDQGKKDVAAALKEAGR